MFNIPSAIPRAEITPALAPPFKLLARIYNMSGPGTMQIIKADIKNKVYFA